MNNLLSSNTDTHTHTHTITEFRYSGGRMAQMTCSCNLELPKEAVISGTKGSIKVDVPFWCPTNMTTPKASKESRCTYDVSFFFFL